MRFIFRESASRLSEISNHAVRDFHLQRDLPIHPCASHVNRRSQSPSTLARSSDKSSLSERRITEVSLSRISQNTRRKRKARMCACLAIRMYTQPQDCRSPFVVVVSLGCSQRDTQVLPLLLFTSWRASDARVCVYPPPRSTAEVNRMCRARQRLASPAGNDETR